MFDSSYDYQVSMNHKPSKEDGFISCVEYRFKCLYSNLLYFVRIERFPDNIFGVKFYPKSFTNTDYKYNKLTEKGGVSKILSTCFKVIYLEIFEKEPKAIVGFIGAANEGEEKERSKRYRVFGRAIKRVFDVNSFHFYDSSSLSSVFFHRKELNSQGLHLNIEDISKKYFDL